MSASPTSPADASDTQPAGADASARSSPQDERTGKSVWAYATMPVILLVVLLALYLWVSGRELDAIESRVLEQGAIVTAVVEHLQLAAVSTIFVLLIAVPLGIALTRPFARRITPPFLAAANVGQAVPTIGVIALIAVAFVAIGFWPAIVALVAYAVLPVLRNTMVGLDQVDRAVLEAGRGMGMTKRGVLWRIELPLAVPVILAGVRTALVINVGTATLATFINAGGLGDIINGGITSNRFVVTATGAVLTAVLALLIDYLAGVAEDVLRPRGL